MSKQDQQEDELRRIELEKARIELSEAKNWYSITNLTSALTALATLKSLWGDQTAKPISVDCSRISVSLFECASLENKNEAQREACDNMKTMLTKHCL